MDTNENNTTIYVKVIQHCMGGFNWECCICKTWFEEDHAAAYLMKVGNDPADPIGGDVHIGDICPACLKAGPKGAAARAHECARALEELAQAQDAIGHLVENIILDDWATVEELQKAGEANEL